MTKPKQTNLSEPEKIQSLRVKVAYLWGLGIGISLTALQLVPKTTKVGDKYMNTAMFGVVVLAAAGCLTWYVKRKEIAADHSANITDLVKKK